MSKTKCKCGNLLSNSMVPNDIELRVYTDREWEEKINLGMIDSINIPLPKYNVWRCPKCERIYVYNWNEDNPIKTYILEK